MKRKLYYFFLTLILMVALISGTVFTANSANIDKEMSNMNIKTATFAMG